jgi:hypothetical protein
MPPLVNGSGTSLAIHCVGGILTKGSIACLVSHVTEYTESLCGVCALHYLVLIGRVARRPARPASRGCCIKELILRAALAGFFQCAPHIPSVWPGCRALGANGGPYSHCL